jgi:putative salt-induced outer membrane protein
MRYPRLWLIGLLAVTSTVYGTELPDDDNGLIHPLDPPTAPSPTADGRWIGVGQGGLLVSSGNASSLAVNGKLDLSYSNGPWKQALFLAGMYGRSQGYVSGERGESRFQVDRQYTERNFWFTGVDAVRDLFSGFDYRVTVSGGLGHRFINTDGTKLSANVGIGYEVYQAQNLIHDANGNLIGRVNVPSVQGMAGTLGLKGEQTLTANTKVLENLAVISTSSDTAIANDLSLNVGIRSQLALSVGYGIRAHTNPPMGAKKVDQATTVNVVYTLK